MFEAPGEALQCAQERKLRALATKAGCRAGQRVLEIGFGWGSLSILLAKHFGCHVTVRVACGELHAARLAGWSAQSAECSHTRALASRNRRASR